MLNNRRTSNSDWSRPNHCYFLALSPLRDSDRYMKRHYLVIQQEPGYAFEVVCYDGYCKEESRTWDSKGVTPAIVLPNELGLIFPWYSLRINPLFTKATRYEIRRSSVS